MELQHQILAVEGDLRKTAADSLEVAKSNFTTKTENFSGGVKTFIPRNEEDMEFETYEDNRELVTTVAEELESLAEYYGKYLDISMKKEATNQKANADLMIGDVPIKNVPVTWLLGFEEHLKKLKNVLAAIPTLQPGIEWVEDEQKGNGIWKAAKIRKTFKTKKILKPVQMAKATKEHPEQVKESMEEVIVGAFETKSWSSMITPAKKTMLLNRIDKTIRNTKRARMEANGTEVVGEKIGNVFFDYLLGD